MRKNLAERQQRMRERAEQEALKPEPIRIPRPSVPEYEPVDYSRPVTYLSDEIQVLYDWPPACGVYLLFEEGEYYIGQAVDVPARYASHRLRPCNCKFEDPRCSILATVPTHSGWTWSQNHHMRLIAEARFIAAALAMGIPLTNTLSEYKRNQLLGMFADLSPERTRLEKALKILC
jgi:hypothetical protein